LDVGISVGIGVGIIVGDTVVGLCVGESVGSSDVIVVDVEGAWVGTDDGFHVISISIKS